MLKSIIQCLIVFAVAFLIVFVCVNSFGTHTSDFNSSRIVCKDKYTIEKTPNGIAVTEKISNDLNYETILGDYIQKQ